MYYYRNNQSLSAPKIAFILSIFSTLILTGCGSSYMIKAENNVVPSTQKDKATIVFMRTSFVAAAIGVEVFEIENDTLELVGAIAKGDKIAHKTTPGKKVYMTHGSASDFMYANVEAGKTYYVILRPNWGTGGFAPTPVRADASAEYNTSSDDFKAWLSQTDLVVKTPEADKWFTTNKTKYQKLYDKYWPRFKDKTPEQIQARTLNVEDGMR